MLPWLQPNNPKGAKMNEISFTLKEAAKVSKIGRNSLLQAIHSKDLEAFRVGKRKFLIAKKSLEKFIDSKIEKGVG
jgi:excisionase family DNA binding protein